MNSKNYDNFFEKEVPEMIAIKGNEIRLFRENERLTISKPSWTNNEGVHMGKTVTINLKANKGNQELIDILSSVLEMLK